MSTLFLHHLDNDHAIALLTAMKDAGRLVIVSDLRRSAIGHLVAQAACHLATRSPIVHHDGPQSVANAFTVTEMRALCAAAGSANARVRRAWPWRLLAVSSSS